MYAVIRSGGKQMKVQPGDKVRLELFEAEEGADVELDDVLAVHDGKILTIGKPKVESAKVKARVLQHGRGRKIIVYRFKRRKGYQKKQGHRQGFTEVMIQDIQVAG